MTSFRAFFLGIAGLTLVLVLLFAGLMGLALDRAIAGYDRGLQDQLSQAARALIVDPDSAISRDFSHSAAFFVFRADGSLLYSNRGQGRSIAAEERVPVVIEGVVVGSWYSPVSSFAQDSLGQELLVTMEQSIAGGLVLALALSVAVAGLLARSITRPLGILAQDLSVLRRGQRLPSRSPRLVELQRIGADLQDISHSLADAEDYRRRWMDNLAHDLRTPVASLQAQLEAMADGVLAADPPRLQSALEQVKRIGSLTQSMGELYHIETLGALDAKPMEAARLVQRLEERAGAPAQVDAESERFAALTLEIDEGLMDRVFDNLLTNARVHGIQGSLELGVRISDHGELIIGISNQLREGAEPDPERVFERFYRGDSSRTTPGSGLGLSIVGEILKRHGGEARVELSHNRFTVELHLRS